MKLNRRRKAKKRLPKRERGSLYVPRHPDTVLDQYLFASSDDVREAVRWWMIEYNEERAHGLLGDRTPIDYVANYARNSTFL
jgi:hypothetical protein